ncbi:MAG: hypothetical protein CR997_09935 [Acidobacteria bacterium]|nr:MAG: hypothetical protein CR997_09935 [Acidobacteriota bacterium]
MIPMDLVGKGMALSCAILWGLAIAFFKRSGDIMSPTQLNLYKTLLTTVLFIPILMITDPMTDGHELSEQHIAVLCLSGILGIALADSLIFKCLNLLGAGLFGIIDCLYSPILIAMSCILLSTSLHFKEVLGSLLVVLAVLVATLRTRIAGERHPHLMAGIALGSLGMGLMAWSIILMKPILEVASVWWVTGIRLMASACVLILMVAYKGQLSKFVKVCMSRDSLKNALPGTLLGNFLAMTIWIAGFKYTDVHSAAVLNQTSTIFIAVFASLILKEAFNTRRIIATILAFCGAVIVIV